MYNIYIYVCVCVCVILCNYITVHGAKNIKLPNVLSPTYKTWLHSFSNNAQIKGNNEEKGTDEMNEVERDNKQ